LWCHGDTQQFWIWGHSGFWTFGLGMPNLCLQTILCVCVCACMCVCVCMCNGMCLLKVCTYCYVKSSYLRMCWWLKTISHYGFSTVWYALWNYASDKSKLLVGKVDKSERQVFNWVIIKMIPTWIFKVRILGLCLCVVCCD
jgi:hypothetical protein